MTEVFKRKLSSDDDNNQLNGDAHVDKKPVLDSLSEDGPLTQQDVVYFQKELIWRQMKAYKKKYEFINSQLESYKKISTQELKKIGLLTLWYDQVLLNFGFSESEEPVIDVCNELLSFPEENHDVEEVSKLRDLFVKALSSVKNKSNISSDDTITKIEQLSGKLANLTSSRRSLEKEAQVLKSHVSSLQQEILDLNQKLYRNESKTILRINSNGVAKEEEVKQELIDGVKVSDELDQKNGINNEEFEKLTIEVNELKDVNANLIKQINEELSNSSNLKKELANLTLRLTNLKEEDLLKSVEYQGLKTEKKLLDEEVNDLRLKVKQYFTKIAELESEKSQYLKNLAADIAKENSELTNNLQRLEQDLVRIRSIRDDLMSKNSILKNEKSYKALVEELTSLIQLQKKRIEELSASRSLPDTIDQNSELDRDQLLQQNSLLVNELKEVELAFKEAHELSIKKLMESTDSASLINKLNVEKSKADQKYFSTMRVNDSLTQENKVSKMTIQKQQELITSLKEVEKKYQQKLVLLELKVKNLKFLENNVVNENQQQKKRISELLNKVESLLDQNGKLTLISEKSVAEKDSELNLRRQKENELVKVTSKLKSVELLNAKYKSNLTGTVLQEDQEQINALRTMVKCSVCSKNWKDTVIKNCGHVFCHECAQERLAARLRRCPSCNKQFSSNDLLGIHL